jgi:hypothetical protein
MGIFDLKTVNTNDASTIPETGHTTKDDMAAHFRDEGFSLARDMKGSLSCLKVCLNRIYREHVDFTKKAKSTFGEARRPEENRIEELKGLNGAKESRFARIKNDLIPASDDKITRFKDDIDEIRANPELVKAHKPSRASFIIGLTILFFLSAYLLVFYTSASYSAFFKEFNEAEIAVSNSIFDAQALTKAYDHGATELIFILLTPFIFFGLGYLIHKFQKGIGSAKYFKVSALIVFTFLFDALLAFEITEKIAFIKSIQAFSSDFVYGISEAIDNPVFWLIIFAGFIVYIIWGFVFDFVMEEHENRDVFRLAVNAKRAKIADEGQKLDDYNTELETISQEIDANNSEKAQLEMRLARNLFVTKEFDLKIDYFMEGWLSWTNGNRLTNLDAELIDYRNNFKKGLGTFEDVSSARIMRMP